MTVAMGEDLDSAVIVALGSNLPGPLESSAQVLRAALARLAERGLKPVRVSSLWRSRAWPDMQDPDYLNAVTLVETALNPGLALAALHAIEAEFGLRSQTRNAPRVLDLDLIAYGRLAQASEPLILPHPRAAERCFVMGPLAEIAPEWRHPALRETAGRLAEHASIGADAAVFGPLVEEA